jgi:hypothetical protein
MFWPRTSAGTAEPTKVAEAMMKSRRFMMSTLLNC